MVYSKELFDQVTAENIGRRFCVLLGYALEHLEEPLESISLLDAEERALIEQWNKTDQEYQGETAYALLEQAACIDPEKTALIYEDAPMSYASLMKHTAQLAMALRAEGAGSDHVVGLVVEKSMEEVCGVVGIIRSGAAYMPLDPKQPSERLEYLCAVTKANTVVAMRKFSALASAMKNDDGKFLNIIVAEDTLYSQDAAEAEDTCSVYAADPDCNKHSMAYALFTSGSTGKPKGLMVEHGSLVCFLGHHTPLGYRADSLFREDVSLFLVSFTFDVSVASMWQPITKGATLVIGKPGAWVDPQYIQALIVDHKVSHMWAVPSPFSLTLQVMQGIIPPTLREIHLIGEALPTPMAEIILG